MAVLTKITSRTLADNSVTSAKISGDVITASDLAPNSVGASELADDAVDTAAIADDAVTNASIADGAIDTAAKLGSNVVTTAKIADSSSTTTGITPAKIAENAVTSAKIATGAVIADGIGAGAVVTTGLGANAVTGAKIAAETIEVVSHIKPGVLHPAYLGNKLDGTATAALTTGPAGSTIASSKYGTVQSDGRMYYYTSINGSKSIKDPRIGSYFGSQRHDTTSLQVLEQETAIQGKQVYSVDGREWMRAVQYSKLAASTLKSYYEAQGTYLQTSSNDYIEVVGYFNDVNISTYYYNGNACRITLNEASEVGTSHGSSAITTPLLSRFVDAGGVVNLSVGATLGINTLKIRCHSSGFKVYNIELIAQDKFTDATCDTTNADATVTMDSTVKLSVGMSVSGTGIAAGSTVASITNATTFELSANATATNSNQTLTFGGSDMSIPPQNVVSYGKKFTVSPQSLHYDPFAYKTDGITAWTSPLSGSNNHNGTAWPVGTGGSHNIDTATSLGLAAWVNTNYYRPYNGGRAVIWVDSSGNVKTSVNMMPPNARSVSNAANLSGGAEKGDDSAGNTSAATPNSNFRPTFTDQVVDNSQAEVAKRYWFREFGNGSANGNAAFADASTLSVNDDIAYVMDDGLTTMTGDNVRVDSGTEMGGNSGAGDFWYMTFIGTGLSTTIQSNIPGQTTYCQNLPYGTHIIRIARTSGTTGTTHLDGVALGNVGENYSYFTEMDFHQPKKPPIPEDAVVLADYMLMADYVEMSGINNTDFTRSVSKGVRRISGTRDVFVDSASALGSGVAQGDIATHGPWGMYSFYSHSSANSTVKLPFFGSKFFTWAEATTGAGNSGQYAQSINSTSLTLTKHNNSFAAHMDGMTNNSSVALGNNVINHTQARGNYRFVGFDLQSPIHTSSHYQEFESPYLKELVGGDRNMEQTNLVVTPDGKTWDELRNTSYIGTTKIRTDHNNVHANANNIFDEWRGQNSFAKPRMNKDFAIGRDRIICLKSGTYLIMFLNWSSTNDDLASIYINNAAVIMNKPSVSGNASGTSFITATLNRGDYVQGKGASGDGSNQWNVHINFEILEIPKG